MADSDITTTLPFVTRWRKGEVVMVAGGRPAPAEPCETGGYEAADPAIVLARVWREAHRSTLALCRLQQRLESRLAKAGRDPTSPPPSDTSGDLTYLQARDAEGRAADVEELLLEELARTPAETMNGVVAKLEVILLEGKISSSPSSFPWPQLRSVLEDLRRVTTSEHPHLSKARE